MIYDWMVFNTRVAQWPFPIYGIRSQLFILPIMRLLCDSKSVAIIVNHA